MFSWIKWIWYALLFVGLLIFFFASWFFSKLINWIIELKNLIWFLVSFFDEPYFWVLAGLIWVIFFIVLIFAWKNTK